MTVEDRFVFTEGVSRCYYCGEAATEEDHVVPRSMLQLLADLGDDAVTAVLAKYGRRMLVPSCRECNSLLSNKYFDTLAARKTHLKQCLRSRYKKLLRIPKWTDEELDGLDASLRSHVVGAAARAEVVRGRIAF